MAVSMTSCNDLCPRRWENILPMALCAHDLKSQPKGVNKFSYTRSQLGSSSMSRIKSQWLQWFPAMLDLEFHKCFSWNHSYESYQHFFPSVYPPYPCCFYPTLLLLLLSNIIVIAPGVTCCIVLVTESLGWSSAGAAADSTTPLVFSFPVN